MKTETFSQKLAGWMPMLKHWEKAELLGVPLDTFRGWLYDKHHPNDFVRQAVEKRMEEKSKP